MITRSLRLRRGRLAIPRPSQPIRQWRRSLAISIRRTAQEQEAGEYDKISADWEFFQHQRAITGKVGADVSRHYKPNNLLRNPPRPQDITLEMLMAAQTHLGHRTSLWHPANSRYIYGVWGQTHDAIHVISLDVTAAHLRRACKVVEGVAARGGLILFVGTRDGQAQAVVRAAELAGGYHLFDKWTPGTLTNGDQILGRCRKKVVNERDAEVLGFDAQLAVRAAIKPDLVVCLNPLENYILLHECGLHAIPTIGIIDTDANPTWVTYPIPANDDSQRSVTTIAGALGKAGEAGQALRRRRAEQGFIDFKPALQLKLPSRDEVQAAKKRAEQQGMDEDFDEDDEVVLTAEEEAEYAQPQVQLDITSEDDQSLETDEALLGDAGLSDGDAPRTYTQQEQALLQKSRINQLESGTILDVLTDEDSASLEPPETKVAVEAANDDAKLAFAQATTEVATDKVEGAVVNVGHGSTFADSSITDGDERTIPHDEEQNVLSAYVQMMRESHEMIPEGHDVIEENTDQASKKDKIPDPASDQDQKD